MAKRLKNKNLKNWFFDPKMLIWPFLGKNSYFLTVSYSNSKPISYYFTGKLGNLGYLGRLKVAKKVRNNQKNIKKVAKTPYFSPFLGFSPGSIERIGWKSFHKFGFARSSTSCDRFGCPFSAGLILKKNRAVHPPHYRAGNYSDFSMSLSLPLYSWHEKGRNSTTEDDFAHVEIVHKGHHKTG